MMSDKPDHAWASARWFILFVIVALAFGRWEDSPKPPQHLTREQMLPRCGCVKLGIVAGSVIAAVATD